MSVNQDAYEHFSRSSFLQGANSDYLESLYETYLEDPQTVSPEWRQLFDQLPATGAGPDQAHGPIRARFEALAKQAQPRVVGGQTEDLPIYQWLDTYRRDGHHYADINPLPSDRASTPSYTTFGLSGSETVTLSDSPLLTSQSWTVAKLEQQLRACYTHHTGYEWMHVTSAAERQWLLERIERTPESLHADEQKALLEELSRAEGMEHFLATRFVGQKRFSLEGGESVIPLLNTLLATGVKHGLEEVCIGMAHRGRLNVMVNVLGMDAQTLFDEFAGKGAMAQTSGDVKYHLGHSSARQFGEAHVHVTLGFNPSHLEIVGPVVLGSVRARQDRRFSEARSHVMPILIHGDAAVTGQGVVAETFNMAYTPGAHVQGTVHVVVNNQVGFTTSRPEEARSSSYCTDVAKMIGAPVIHVNGDDPEAVYRAAQLAADYRFTFQKDVVIDLVCYRRLGHNEADEPAATQPGMYAFIRKHPTTRFLYSDHLISAGVLTAEASKAMTQTVRQAMEAGQSLIPTALLAVQETRTALWKAYLGQAWDQVTDTSLSAQTLQRLGQQLVTLPEGFTCQRQVGNLMKQRQAMLTGDMPIRWGFAETLAYASLIEAGYTVRLMGQDSERGTFGHRHAVLHDTQTGQRYTPLHRIEHAVGHFQVHNSTLSEAAVLAYEYGYASTDPRNIVLWEAQFGDFANGAQVVIDQFISSAYQKWKRLSGLVLLLPHGYEGMGPEHSSARLERFIQLCAQDNIQVCVPTTAAQIFHLLRRQALRTYRRPLVIMSPKSVLRLPHASSPLQALQEGAFQNVMPDTAIDASEVRRVVLCSGKIYFALEKARAAAQRKDIALIRIEQLYPFPADDLQACLKAYGHVKTIVWCQEEPQNQGAWYGIRHYLEAQLATGQGLVYHGRPGAAAPACGYATRDKQEEETLVQAALGLS